MKSDIVLFMISIGYVYAKDRTEADIKIWFDNINKKTLDFNTIAADISWNSSINPLDVSLPNKAALYQKYRLSWQEETCNHLADLWESHLLNDTQKRQTYLLCRGPALTFSEARQSSDIYEELQSMYSDSRICIPKTKSTKISNLKEVEEAVMDYLVKVKQYAIDMGEANNYVNIAVELAVKEKEEYNDSICLRGEPDLEKLMSFSRNEKVLKWAWLVWREKVGPPMRKPYLTLVDIQNKAARRNGYANIGVSWRDELEIQNLRRFCHSLYSHIRPLYMILHGVMRYYLRRIHGNLVPERGLIPAHLLGNLWSQNWESLTDIIHDKFPNIDESIAKANWNVFDMVKNTEDFYQSLGLPPMTEKFWQRSVFGRENNEATRCHGTAADMFQNGDFRLLYCSGRLAEDFYVLHHELGHIQYYMAYETQPAIFRQGANSAFHESIGDAIMHGVLSPQHLHRLGLINDSYLFVYNDSITIEIIDKKKSSDNMFTNYKVKAKNARIHDNYKEDEIKMTKRELFLLMRGLNQIPQIPFALMIEEYRWKLFEGSINKDELNEKYWDMAAEYQGIAEPDGTRGEIYFDAGAKFHVPDNTPYIRYYLSSFLQHQLFESLCKAAVFGTSNITNQELPPSISLDKCDIYGSKAAGKILRNIMSKGSSQHWSKTLKSAIGTDAISHSSFNRYYFPLKKLLMRMVRAHDIPVGW